MKPGALGAAPGSASLCCGNCGGALQPLQLAGHYGRQVEIDLCEPCHLLWFDTVETARLAGPGLLALIGRMAAAHALAHRPLSESPPCPHCRQATRTVHNRSRWGLSLQLECPQGHGAWQSFAQFLGEKGLLRPMSLADRHRALQSPQGLCCVNCGGALTAGDGPCPFCGSVPALVDVARLAHALDPEGATRGHAVHRHAARRSALACQACGAALPEAPDWNCPQCGATLTAPGLAEAHRAVSALAPALQAHAEKPAPHVVRERLQAHEPALQRQRERARQMQQEADQRAGRVAPEWPEEGLDWAEPAARGLLAALRGLLRRWRL